MTDDLVDPSELTTEAQATDALATEAQATDALATEPPVGDGDGDDGTWFVVGHVTWPEGTPAVDVIVRAYDQDLRDEQPLGPHAPDFARDTRTDRDGVYAIAYRPDQFSAAEIARADLVVKVLDEEHQVVVTSPTTFNAPPLAEVDLGLAGAVAGHPSEYERLVDHLAPLLLDATPPGIEGLLPTDQAFLVGESGWPAAAITALLSAVQLVNQAAAAPGPPASSAGSPNGPSAGGPTGSATPDGRLIPALYGLFRQGQSPAWTDLARIGTAALAAGITAAAEGGTIPVSLSADAQNLAQELSATAAAQALAPGGSSSPSPAAGLLTVAGVPADQQATLLTSAAAAETPEAFWSELPTQPGWTPPAVAKLQLTLQLGLLTGNHQPLVEHLLADSSVTSVADLVSMDQAAWEAALQTTVNGQPVGVPPGTPGATPAEQAANYASALQATVQAAFPNQTVAHLVSTDAALVADATTRSGVSQFFADAPTFDLRTDRVSDFVKANPGALQGVPAGDQAGVVTQVQRLQRAFQISVSSATFSALVANGLDAAHKVAAIPPQTFLDLYAGPLGGPDAAQGVYQRATFLHARTVDLMAQFHDTAYGTWPSALSAGQFGKGSTSGIQQILEAYPEYTELFGALDSCGCEDCLSVLSPAAYFVDLLQFLAHSAPNPAGNTPLDVLIGNGGSLVGRRPDLADLKLTCENTDTEIPYIDLVNEVLEAYVLYNGPNAAAAHDTGSTTSAQLGASPQYTLADRQYQLEPPSTTETPGPYFTLMEAVYPFTLPFTQPLAVTRTYLSSLGTSRHDVLAAFQPEPASAQAAVDAERLGIDPALYQLLTGEDLTGAAVAAPAPATLYGYPASDAGWTSEVASVPTFLTRTGVGLDDLTAMLATASVNPNYPAGPDLDLFESIPFSYSTLMTLVADGFTTTDPTVESQLTDASLTLAELSAWWSRHPNLGQVLVIDSPDGTCDLTHATLAHLGDQSVPTAAELVAFQSFVRLWRVTGWSVADLDRAFRAMATTTVTAAFVHQLATIDGLQAALSPPSLQVLFGLWADLDPSGADSLYTQLFVNPAALPLDPAFTPTADGAVLQDASATLGDHTPALVAALQVGADDLALIQAAAGLTEASTLSLANVSTLFRYAALAQLLGLSVSDFLTLRQLAGPSLDPFVSPDQAQAFVTLAGQLAATGFSATQLGYLYQHASAPPTGLAPQQTTLVVLAQTLHAGLTQIAARCAPAPDPKGTLTASTVTQLVSKAVATETVAIVNGTANFTAPLATLPAGLAKRDGTGDVLGVDPTLTPAEVGAKLSWEPVSGTLAYAGAMTSQEETDLLAVSADPSYQAAITSLFTQPATFVTANLSPLLDDPGAIGTLLRTTASLDGSLNPILVDAGGNPVTDPTLAAGTAIAEKFAYLLGKLLPYLQSLLSHTLVKQTLADAFSLDPDLTSALVEQLLTSPSTAGQPVVTDLLGLGTSGVTATTYPSADLSGPPASAATVPAVDYPGGSSALAAGTGSASFASWLSVPASGSFAFAVESNGTPRLFVGDPTTPLTLTTDPTTGLPTATVALVAGTLVPVTLEITAFPAGPATAVLSWSGPGTPGAPVPASAQLPAAAFSALGLAYVRIQKAALLATGFPLDAAELTYLQAAGGHGLFAGFDLNALPLAPGITAAQATALFASWPRLAAYTTLRNSLPKGSVTLVDVFGAPTFAAAETLVPQATGWPAAVASAVLAGLLPAAPPTGPNPLVDELVLTRVQTAVALAQRVGASPAQLFSWALFHWASPEATYDALAAIAADVTKATESHTTPQAWLSSAVPLSDAVRTAQRDALVAYLLGLLNLDDPDRLFELLLIDPEMGTCMETSRIRQALNSAQLFVQRCLLNLEAGGPAATVVEPSQIDATTWNSWMSAYSIWAANREVFLWPENWLLPSLRDDQTPQFAAFASALQQTTITDDAVSSALLAYLQDVEAVDRLDIRTVFWQPPDPSTPGGPDVLHVFGRTFNQPTTYSYRRLIGGTQWTPWETVSADIQGDQVVAAVWEGRLRLIWPVFTQQTYNPPPSGPITSGHGANQTPIPGSPPMTYWQISLAWSEYYQGAWQSKQVTPDYLISYFPLEFYPSADSGIPQAASQDTHVFKARVDGADLVVEVYVDIEDGINGAVWPGGPALPYLLGEFRFSACGDGMAVSYDLWVQGIQTVTIDGQARWVPGLPPSITPAPDQTYDDTGTATVMVPPGTDPYQDGFLQQLTAAQKLTLKIGNFGDNQWGMFQSEPGSTSRTFLDATPTQFELRVDQQNWQFAAQSPFFYQDGSRTFCVTPSRHSPWYRELTTPGIIDVGSILTGLTTPVEVDHPQLPGGGPVEVGPVGVNPVGVGQIGQLGVGQAALAAQAGGLANSPALTAAGQAMVAAVAANPAGRAQVSGVAPATPTALVRPAALPAAGSGGPSPSAARSSTAVDAVTVPADGPQGVGAGAISVESLTEDTSAANLDWADYQAAAVTNWATKPKAMTHRSKATTYLTFQTHRHPYVCDLIKALVAAQGTEGSGGISGLLNVANQKQSNGFDFAKTYYPTGWVDTPYPTEVVDFSATGAYSDYNWELFFHAPLLVALTLSQNQQFAQADTWFRYIFDPTNSDKTTPSPERYWQVEPFRTAVPQTLLDLMTAIDQGDANAVAQVTDWYQHPFEPFRIARLRNGAFMKYVFMAYLDNLIAWGDQLFGQVDTIESINQATQLYVFASELLGPLPQELPPAAQPVELSYRQVRSKLDAFSNFSELIENQFPFSGGVTSGPQSQAGGLLGMSSSLFFCIPDNAQLLGYWSTVADRLYKIRNCLNIHGTPQQLALFQPPANPLLLIEAAAEGIDPGSVLASLSAPLPNYRFNYLVAKAGELAGMCQSFGRTLLDALEKYDNEGLAVLRATQEEAVLVALHDQKVQAVNEANANVAALNGSRAVAVAKLNFYQTLLGQSPTTPAQGSTISPLSIPEGNSVSSGGVNLIAEEQSEITFTTDAAELHVGAGVLQTLGAMEAMIPNISIGLDVQPFGVGSNMSISFGGSNLASATEADVHVIETLANYLTYQAWSSGKMGTYVRRQQEWTNGYNLAAAEIMQIDLQLAAAGIRVTIATDDQTLNETQQAHAQKVIDYLTTKFTNQQLYGWMVSQASSLYSQLYQLAYSTAQQAEVAYQRELGVAESSYITFGYWDSLRKGLLAGDRLLLAIKQLERAYQDQNLREFEITRHVSLLLHDPAALMALKTTGECVVDLPEQLFDLDYPGHYLRRLRDVSLTIPCVAGPYTAINCTLTLVSSKVRVDPSSGSAYAEKPTGDTRFVYYSGSTAAIATSHAQDDSGVFSVNFRDERYLPFETAGAVSRWLISMPPVTNAFDFDTITDVVMKLSYSARYGGDLLRSHALAAATLPAHPTQTAAPTIAAAPKQSARDRLFSARHEFPTGWYGLLHPSDPTAAYGQMPLVLSSDRFPFAYRGRTLKTTDIEVFALLESGATVTSLDAYLTATGAPPPSGTLPTPPAPNTGTDHVGLAAEALYGTGALYGVKAESSPVAVPQLWWLSVPAAQLAELADQVEDFFLLFHFNVT